MQINSFLAYLCNYSRSTTKKRPKKHDFSPHPALQSNGTDFAVQNPRIDDIEKQVEQEVQLVSRLVEMRGFALQRLLPKVNRVQPKGFTLQSNGTAFAVQNPCIDDIEKQVEQKVQLVSLLVEMRDL
ncbi:MAG: hypothetical protein SPK47_00805 [Eubacteriales bacterium]|nr:hypothetical protein [Clostridiales bacterium]MDY5719811.1 hypothetical protein [Eubacteriales bacterium]